ncbi:SusC/RagA family TonB-linked outer membrane protein [Pedobacter yulinensis]|uniref:SusC/RagA family TonB-linked outer membrane protein n=1 Tax=Pedobacter yulinensis TaxID=2126353 RepID=A0A2T3HLM7_9SPHI|nr:SusC/RagA family TonB-linked outer membrane protein [Pedobacter yulinensis]PST83345.1 SusC/RagA family TonB-linked outer membrane protein [Pedobacter yulinensis]
MNRKSTLFLVFLLFACTTFAQQTIRGKITDAETGEAIPGVSVVVKGTTSGVSSQPDGTYSIITSANGAVLVFSSVGYLSQEIPAGTRTQISVAMRSSNTELSEVVVTALGIRREERSIGYSAQQVKGENLTFTKEQNVIGSLAGKVSGVQVTGSSGASMGGTQKVKIRSVNSITGNGSPLMVVDGTPIAQNNFGGDANGVDYGNVSQDINPEDIESVNVLKGPAASALYGIRGQYGVILITTKKGSRGAKKVSVNLNTSYMQERVGNFMPLQNIYGVGNNQTFLTLANGQKYVNGNDESWGPKMDGTPVRMYYSFYPQDPQFGQLTPFVPQPDNIKDFFETGHNVNNGISLTGNTEKSNYRVSYNNAYINGTIPNTWLKRNNLGFAGSFDLAEKLKLGINANYANNEGQRPTQGYQGSFTGAVQWFQRNLDINRLRSYKYPDGTIMNWNVNPTSAGIITNNRPSDWNNPFFDAYESLNNDSRDRLFGDINLSYQVLPSLKLSGFVRSDMYTQNISHKEAAGGRLLDGYSVNKYQNTENNYEFLAEFQKKFGDMSLNLNAGANLYTLNFDFTSQATVGGLSSPGLYTIAASVDRPVSTSGRRRKHVRSAYAMASVGFKDIYFLDASIRNDVSSTLPSNNNSYVYPSVSGSMMFSELLKWEPLSFGKLRASYAIAGSDLDPYQILMAYGLGSVYQTNTSSINTILVPDLLKNPNIKPAFARAFEVGTDLKFFGDRLGLEFTWYMQRNKDQIINLSVSGASGFDRTIVNAGLIENKGIELSLNALPVKSKFLTWNTSINLARNRNKVVDLYPGVDVYELDANLYSSQTMFLNSTRGASFGNLVGPGYQVDPATGKYVLGADNLPVTATNKDFGSVLPQFTGGFVNNFRIGSFDLAAVIDFQQGGKFFSWSRMLAVKSGQALETAGLNENGVNVREPLANGGGVRMNGIYAPGTRQTINGVSTDVGGREFNGYVDARSYYRNAIGTRIYDEWVYDASFVKLREVSLGYNLSADLLKKTPFRAAKLAVIARNPVMIWQKAPKGIDPSELSSGSAAISWIEKGELQTVRSFGLNLNLTF